MEASLSLPLWIRQKRVLLAGMTMACLAWLWLWPHVRGSWLGIRAQDMLYLALEDCTAVVPRPLANQAHTFVRAHRVRLAPNGCGAFQAHAPARARRAASSSSHKWFVYESPSEFTTLLLDEPHVDVAHTPMSVLDKHALGPEVMFHKYLLDDTTGRTTRDPEVASLFFVPFYASSSRSASKWATSKLYTKLITHLRTSAPYWDRYGGHDHVFVLGRHYTERTAFGRSSLSLVLQDTPIFLTFEMTNYHAEDLTQHVWRMARNVIIPRPDPFSHLSSPQCPEAGVPPVSVKRPFLVAYVGSQISEFRRRLVSVLQERLRSNSTSHDAYVRAFCRDERGAMSESTKFGETTSATDTPIPVVYRMADFCPCPRGDSLSDSRMYDALRAGCIPVLFSKRRMHAFEDHIHYEQFVITADWVTSKQDMRLLMKQLRSMPEAEKADRRRAMLRQVPLLSYDPTVQVNAFTLSLDAAMLRARMLHEYDTPMRISSSSHTLSDHIHH